MALFGAATLALFQPVVAAGPSRHTALLDDLRGDTPNETDQLFVAFVVARNARALLADPLDFFDAPHCFPARASLALGEPMITLGLFGAPIALLGGSPVLVFNVALWLTLMAGALAVFLLVRDWTGEPVAGIVAGLLCAFHASRGDTVHPYIYDTAWTALALFFARRLLATGAWRDAIGLAASGALQIGTSLYALLGGGLVALPIAARLAWHYRLRRARVGQLLLPALAALGAALFGFAPYLRNIAEGHVWARETQIFAAPGEFLPGGLHFPGWAALGLALVALLARRSRVTSLGWDPRPPLALGILLAAGIAAGPHLEAWKLPDLYALAAAVLPGLDIVRVPARIAAATQLGFAILAGLGAARLLRLGGGRARIAASAALLAGAYLVSVRAPFLEPAPAFAFHAREIAPPQWKLDFFAELEAAGNRGPLVEIPVTPREGDPGLRQLAVQTLRAEAVFASAYHGRPTSSCVSSYVPAEVMALSRLEEQLPAADAVRELRRLGFTTLIADGRVSPRFRRAEAIPPGSGLRFLARRRVLTAIGLAEPDDPLD